MKVSNERINELIEKLNNIIVNKKSHEREDEFLKKRESDYIYFSRYYTSLFEYLNSFTKGQVSWRIMDNAINFYVDDSNDMFLTTDFKSGHVIKVGFFIEEVSKCLPKIQKEFPGIKVTIAGDGGDWFYLHINNFKNFKEIIKKSVIDSYINKVTYVQQKSNRLDFINVKELLFFNPEKIEENNKINNFKDQIDQIQNMGTTEKEQVLKLRIGQGRFKEMLLKSEGKCKICGLSNKNFLIASHIKPWSKSTNEERLDCYNGFLLCPHHDALFDKGFITFKDTGEIIISCHLDEQTRRLLNINRGLKINVVEENLKYLKWHREDIFKDNISGE